MEDDFLYGNSAKNLANGHRCIVKESVEKLALPNVIHLPGLEILNGSRWLSEDMVHPNARGVEELARNLISKIEKYI
jgi:lysophospholipase L1-like esterase